VEVAGRGSGRILSLWLICSNRTEADVMEIYPVSPLVNKVGNDSADLMVPVGE
jgi:putative SOS response-associated peptidase YedK